MRNKQRTFHPGRSNIFWCDDCNVPLLSNSCSLCGGSGKFVYLSPPADVRLCSEAGRNLIKDLFEINYGSSGFLDNRIILFNKIAGIDRRDQVVVDGHLIASISFDITTGIYKLDLELAGAFLLAEKAIKKVVICSEALRKGHLKGKWIEKHQVIESNSGLNDGDSVILKIGGLVGVGIVRTRDNGSSAIRVKDIGRRNLSLNQHSSDINSAVKANETHLLRLEQTAVRELKGYFNRIDQPVNVSFSGGKDSLAALALTLRAKPNVELLFINTGLEFPETVNYVQRFCSERKLKLRIIQEKNKFFEQLEIFGPPAKDFRWCCKTNKLGPLTSYIEKHYPKGCVTVEGRRIYESFSRARIQAVEKNPFVPNQTTLCPIRNWNALEVMIYLNWKKLPLNPLYEKDYERIGCWLCPAALQSELANTKKTHPQLYNEWTSYLQDWAKNNGLEAKYIDWGFWRWKKHPSKVMDLAQSYGINLRTKPTEKKDIRFDIVKGVSPCGLKFSIEAKLTIPQNYPFESVAKALTMLGKTKYSDELGVANLTLDDCSCTLFANGHILVIAPERKAKSILKKLVETILRVQMCTGCGICEKSCPQEALKIIETMEVDEKRCNLCGKCAKGCIIANQALKMITFFAS
ncbi:MAG: phosphoadenosine phosphosulfate reductase family protein [Methanotrichaceae archaeon]|nr:phosphoadenosine phosphosulfate reductase family protein [Methanotrichaceae archaeon]